MRQRRDLCGPEDRTQAADGGPFGARLCSPGLTRAAADSEAVLLCLKVIPVAAAAPE